MDSLSAITRIYFGQSVRFTLEQSDLRWAIGLLYSRTIDRLEMMTSSAHAELQ